MCVFISSLVPFYLAQIQITLFLSQLYDLKILLRSVYIFELVNESGNSICKGEMWDC